MSRSRKKAIVKDNPKRKELFRRRIRRTIKTSLASGKEELPNPKTIVNDYDYCDYKFNFEYRGDWGRNKKAKEKYARK